MRFVRISLALLFVLAPALAQEKTGGPNNEKAQKTYKEAFQYLHERRVESALDSFKKADKQDGGHCLACQKQMIKYGLELGEWKTAEQAAEKMVAEAQDEEETAIAHQQLAVVLMDEGLRSTKTNSSPAPMTRASKPSPPMQISPTPCIWMQGR
jgi:tetratricopeptide (TPR) repeat protein